MISMTEIARLSNVSQLTAARVLARLDRSGTWEAMDCPLSASLVVRESA